jgi:hypothetical protein
MPRGKPKRIDRPVEKTVSLPQTVVTRVDLELFSAIDGKVPFGAWAGLIEGLLLEWLEKVGKQAAQP